MDRHRGKSVITVEKKRWYAYRTLILPVQFVQQLVD